MVFSDKLQLRVIEYFEETAKTLYALGSDARIREECRRRNDHLKQQKYYETTIATQGETIKEQDMIIKEQNATIVAQEARIAELEALIAKNK